MALKIILHIVAGNAVSRAAYTITLQNKYNQIYHGILHIFCIMHAVDCLLFGKRFVYFKYLLQPRRFPTTQSFVKCHISIYSLSQSQEMNIRRKAK